MRRQGKRFANSGNSNLIRLFILRRNLWLHTFGSMLLIRVWSNCRPKCVSPWKCFASGGAWDAVSPQFRRPFAGCHDIVVTYRLPCDDAKVLEMHVIPLQTELFSANKKLPLNKRQASNLQNNEQDNFS